MPPKATYGKDSRSSFKPPRPVGQSRRDTDQANAGVARYPQAKGPAEVAIAAGSSSEASDDPIIDEGEDSEASGQVAGALPRQSEDVRAIPPKLLARLVHEHFQHDDTRITQEAMAVLSKYVEFFAMEAVGRANEEREEAAKADRTVDGDFLEVEDLEKLAPQLLLDF